MTTKFLKGGYENGQQGVIPSHFLIFKTIKFSMFLLCFQLIIAVTSLNLFVAQSSISNQARIYQPALDHTALWPASRQVDL